MMDRRDIIVTLAAFLLIIFIAGNTFLGMFIRTPNIAQAVDSKFPMTANNGSIRTYNSPDDVNRTIDNIVSIKRPYDMKVQPDGKSILLYDEAVLVIQKNNGNTEIELIKDHRTAYNRYRSTMIFFWGGNLLRNGRIRTPGSLRNGSIGSSSNRGGGFGFGK